MPVSLKLSTEFILSFAKFDLSSINAISIGELVRITLGAFVGSNVGETIGI